MAVHEQVSDDDLLAVEHTLLDGFRDRRTDGVDVIGFGETGVAISWPRGDGRFVIKRVVSVPDPDEAADFARQLGEYVDAAAEHVRVAPTDIRTLPNRDGRHALFIVQPLYANEQLVETIMEHDEPSPDHAVVRTIVDVVLRATETRRLGVDAQFQNFAWIDGEPVLFDIGTPLMFEADGTYAYDTSVVGRIMPAPLRRVARRKYEEVVIDIGSREGALQQTAMSLVRVGQERWLPAVLDVVNPHLAAPLDADAVVARAAHLHRQSAGLKKMMRLERWWSTRVRRRPYDMFITDSFTGEIL
ncbi:MAG: DUF6206 family protein [Actinomycetota bacterium]